MSFLLAGAAVIGAGAGIAKAISGGKQKKAAKAEEAKAKQEMQKQKDAFSKLDTSNPFANMENKMEDLTVNQGEADFMKAQQQQSQANIMKQMKGAAGGSGVAALAQTMANQGSMDAQKSAISIGKQEQGNQMAERQAASQIQNQERQGEIQSRDMERNKVSTLLGMAQSEKAAAGQKVAAADSKMWSGITGAAGAVAGGIGGMSNAGMLGGGGGGASSNYSVSGTGLDLSNDQYTSPIDMKGSPLKAADSTLVQGAYNAAIGGTKQNDGMGQGMDALMKIAGEAVTDIAANRKAKQEEGDDLANSILDTGGSLGDSWLDVTQGEVTGMHGDFKKNAAFGRKNKTAKGMQDLNTLSAQVASIKDLNTEIADAQSQKDWSSSVSDKEQGVFNAFMDNSSKKRVTKGEDGKRVFEVETPDGWKSTKDIERMMGEHKKDYKTMTDIRKQTLDQVEKAKADALKNKESGYKGGGYDTEKAKVKMDNTLRNSNLKSLMHDDVLENGKPFITAIQENPEITGLTYASLGLPIPPGDDGIIGNEDDPDGANTVLKGEHQGLVIDALTNTENELYDEERTRGMMAGYFTGFVSQNYDNEYTNSGGKYTSDAVGQYGEDAQSQADEFMKRNNI